MHFAYNVHMAKTLANIQFRMNANEKKKLAKTLEEIGLDIPTALRMFAMKVINFGGIPFYVEKSGPYGPMSEKGKRELRKALKEAEDPKNLIGPFYDAKSLIASLRSQ